MLTGGRPIIFWLGGGLIPGGGGSNPISGGAETKVVDVGAPKEGGINGGGACCCRGGGACCCRGGMPGGKCAAAECGGIGGG